MATKRKTLDELAEVVGFRMMPKLCCACGRLIGEDHAPVGERKSGDELLRWNQLTAGAGFSHGYCRECNLAVYERKHRGSELVAYELRVIEREIGELVDAAGRLRQLRRRLRRELAEVVN